MTYCDTFHWTCLLDPFYLLGAVVWLWLTCALVAVALAPLFWLFVAIGQAIHNERRAR